jgi:hypothetical protein
MSIYYRHLIEDGYLLDIYPNAAAAYSLRKLRDGYTGALFAVRRSVDNALLDVFPNSQGTFDETVVEDWVGYNLFTFSEQLQNVAYIKTRLTVSQDALTAPDGTMTADILLETVDNNNHQMTRNFGVTNGQTYTYSFFVKAAGRDFIRIATPSQLSQNPGTSGVAFLDIVNGTIVSQNSGFLNGLNSANLTITSVGNDWFRVSYTMPCTITSTPSALQINLSADGTTVNYPGDVTKGVSIWGVQISELNTLKPYQKTETTAGGGGFVQVWYDQSGNGNNISQLTVSLQHSIVIRGTVPTYLGKPVIRLTSSGNSPYVPISNIPTTSPHFSTSVYRYNGAGNFATFGNRSVGGSPRAIYQSSTDIWYRITNSSNDQLVLANNNSGGYITSVYNLNNLMELYINNTLFGSRNTPFTGARVPITSVGSFSSSGVVNGGDWFEMIWWNIDYSNLRTNITQEINNYYEIY